MDHWKIVAGAIGMSLLLALVILGTDSASAVDYSSSRRGGPLASTVGSGAGSDGSNDKTLKPPIQPGNSVAAKPSVTVTLGAWRNMRPTESMLHGVSLLPSSSSVDCQSPNQKSKGWIVGDGGVILNYCNGIWDHAIIVESVPTNLYAVQAISPTLGVAVGDQGAILLYFYESTAADYVWTKSPIQVGDRRLYGLSMVPDGMGNYVGWTVGWGDSNVGGRGTLVQGTIYGPTGFPPSHSYNWMNVTNVYTSLPAVASYYSVHTLAPNNSWAVGGTTTGTGIIIRWDGSEWAVYQYVPDELYGLYMKSSSDGWAVGNNGGIYHFDGSTWSKVVSPTTQSLSAVKVAPNGEQWIVGYKNALLKYSGGSWQQVGTDDLHTDAYDFRAVDFTSGRGWLVGANFTKGIGGQILEYDNGSWFAVTTPTDNRLNAVAVLSDNNAWAVGAADASGGTIIHWDGKHWARWYQHDLPIPAADLYAIDMSSPTDGWAAGDPLGGPAIFLHWDGHRWAMTRFQAPVNVRVNGLRMYDSNGDGVGDFGWAVAENGDAVAKYRGPAEGFWDAVHSCQGIYYRLSGTSIISATNPWGNWDAWAVGKRRANYPPYNPLQGVFMRFMPDCGGIGGSNAWDIYQNAPIWPSSGPNDATLYGISLMPPEPWGYAVGNDQDHATIYSLHPISQTWSILYRHPDGPWIPSNLYSVDIDKSTGVAWLGGYYTSASQASKWAYIGFVDAIGYGWAGEAFPVNGRNIYNRPIKNVAMSSLTMGWAVGDPEDGGKKSVLYQYPYPNFTLDTYPAARAVLPGGSTFFTATANSLGGFIANVSLGVSGPLPGGIVASASPPTLNPPTVSTINITAGGTLGTFYVPLAAAATFRSGDNIFPVQRTTSLKVTVTNHPVYSVSPSHGAAGTVVTITGPNFGPDPGAGNRGTPTNHVSWAGVTMPSASVLSWNNTQITFVPPDSPGLFSPAKFPLVGRVKVTAGGSDSNDDYTFRMDPHIGSIAKTSGGSVITVTLTGTSFGNDPGSYFRSTALEHVGLNGVYIPSLSVLSWSNNSIVFTIPLTSLGGSVTVTSNGFESNSVYLVGAPRQFLPLLTR